MNDIFEEWKSYGFTPKDLIDNFCQGLVNLSNDYGCTYLNQVVEYAIRLENEKRELLYYKN